MASAARAGKSWITLQQSVDLALNQHTLSLQIAGIVRRIVGKEANSHVVKITNPVEFEFLVVDQ